MTIHTCIIHLCITSKSILLFLRTYTSHVLLFFVDIRHSNFLFSFQWKVYINSVTVNMAVCGFIRTIVAYCVELTGRIDQMFPPLFNFVTVFT